MESWVGQQLGPYELQDRLGAGGMGVVYRAVHRRLGQARAIKVLPAMLAHDDVFVQRFEREARLASELRHPNIVIVHDIAEEKGAHYIVMELLDGRSLHEVIRHDGPLPLERAIRLLHQLADALDFAHQRGVVHRDVKPGNAIVGANDHLTLVDFGIARAAEGSRLTGDGTRIGTAEYMAPESITVGDSGKHTDLYALGVITYEMMTGRVPFTGLNSQTIMYAQIHTPPPPPHTFRADLPTVVEQVVLRQLDKNPANRYPSGAAFVQALEDARTGAPSVSPPSGYSAPDSGPAPTAWLAGPSGTGPTPATGPGSVAAATSHQPVPSATPRPGHEAGVGPRTPSRPLPPSSGRTPVPPPPTTGESAVAAPAASGLHRAIAESRLSMTTLYKLSIGGIVLALLLMCFLPTPHDPLRQSFTDRLAFPFGVAGGHPLGTDELGRDVLSRMMSGGRFLVIRLAIIGAAVVGATVLIRRRRARRSPDAARRSARAVTPMLVWTVTAAMVVSVLCEFILAVVGSPAVLQYLGPVGRVLLGVPRMPPSPSWGGMLEAGLERGLQAPWLPFFPGAGLALVALALLVLGSGLVDVLKHRVRRGA